MELYAEERAYLVNKTVVGFAPVLFLVGDGVPGYVDHLREVDLGYPCAFPVRFDDLAEASAVSRQLCC